MALTEIGSVQVATLHDALQKAKNVAPTKGNAFDRAQGIHLTFVTDGIEVRATNLEMTYWQLVPAATSVENGWEMRLPSGLLSAFVAGIPMASESDRLRFLIDTANPRSVTVQFGNKKLKAKMATIMGEYPQFAPIDVDEMKDAQELASKLEMVAWAADDQGGVLSGTYIDGEYLVSMTTKMAARAHCVIDAEEAVVAIMRPLVPLIKLGTTIRMKVLENKLVIALDEASQVTSTVILQPYPVHGLEQLGKLPHDSGFTVGKQRFIDGLTRLLVAVRNDRLPRCSVNILDGQLHMSLRSDSGEIEDACIVSDQTWTVQKDLLFNPTWLIDALESFNSSTVKVRYMENNSKSPLHLTTPDGEYETWVMPMQDIVGPTPVPGAQDENVDEED